MLVLRRCGNRQDDWDDGMGVVWGQRLDGFGFFLLVTKSLNDSGLLVSIVFLKCDDFLFVSFI